MFGHDFARPGESEVEMFCSIGKVDERHISTSAARAERRIVESAVRQNGLALQWASENLRADRDVASRRCVPQGSDLGI